MPTIVIGGDSTGVKLMTTPDNNPVNTVVVGVPQNGSGSGSVTSIAVSGSDGIGVSGSPITTSGTIALTLGDITPDSIVAAGTIEGSNLSGTNTGDQNLSGLMVKSANLSDVVSASSARSNLGLGALAILSTIGTTQIDARSVTFPKLPSITDNRLVGRSAGSDGDLMHITVGSGLSLSAGTLTATGSGGSVTSVSVTTANGVSGVVNNPTTTPAITLTLGAITPTSVAASGALSGSNFSGSSSGTNTGDQDLSGLMVKASNLSDLTNAATGRSNLGVSTTANIAASTDKNYVTDSQLVIIGNTSGTNTGDQTITLTGDVTGSGTGSFAATIGNDKVTTVKILDANVTLAKIEPASGASKLLGRGDSGAGVFQEIALGTNLSMSGTTLNASGGGTPGGSDAQLQYNNAGAFGGISLSNWSSDVLTLGTFTANANHVQIITNAAGGYGLSVNSSSGAGSGVLVVGSSGIGINLTTTTGVGILQSSTSGIAVQLATTGGQLLTGTVTNATTNVATDVVLTLGHDTSGTAANNFGARVELQLESSTTAGQTAGYLQWDWLDATHAGRDSRLRFFTVINGSSTEMLALGAGTAASGVTLPQLGSGILTSSSGVVNVSAPTANKVLYGSGAGGPLVNTNFHFDSTNLRLAVGAASAGATFHGVANTATTNALVNGLLLGTNSTGTPANGLGGAVFFNIETSTTADTNAGQIGVLWTDVTHASRTSAFVVKTVDNAAAVTERFRVGGLASKFSGGIQLAIAAKTADYPMTEADTAITSDATGGVVTITLPSAALAGHVVFVKRIDASGNNTIVSRAGSDTIEGSNSVTLTTQYESVTLIADGTSTWYIISTT